MTSGIRIVTPGNGNILLGEKGEILTPPDGWKFYPAGDAGVTRRITSSGIFWRVQIRRGRKIISTGVWAPEEIVSQAAEDVESARSTEAYAKKLESSRKRREKKQAEYEGDFFSSVKNYLSFDPCHSDIEEKLAHAVTQHATPVGSGTVARTAMIPIEERAAAAVIAWLRHRTTGYDTMVIPGVKGKRRETRRMLAQRSAELLELYRRGTEIPADCPLKKALNK